MDGGDQYGRDKKIVDLIISAKDYRSEEAKAGDYSNLINDIFKQNDRIIGKEKVSLICAIDDIDIIKKYINRTIIGISNSDKIKIILNQTPEFIEDILKGKENPNIGYAGRAEIIKRMQNREENNDKQSFYQNFIDDPEYRLSDADKVELIRAGRFSQEYIKSFIEVGKIQSEYELVSLLLETRDPLYINAYVSERQEDESQKLDVMSLDRVIREIGSKTQIEEWESNIITRDNISEFTLEELRQMPKETMIKLVNENTMQAKGVQQLYSVGDFIAIKTELDNMLEGIESAEKGNRESELQTFFEVYKRLSKIRYDEYAISSDGKNDEMLQTTCRSLKGGILGEECVCAGYAEILRNALAEKNVECRYVSGAIEGCDGGHAWNQVKIGESWYNVDLTWDRDEIFESKNVDIGVLKTDEQFKNHADFVIDSKLIVTKCDVDITDATSKVSRENISNAIETIAINQGIRLGEIADGCRIIKNAHKKERENQRLGER